VHILARKPEADPAVASARPKPKTFDPSHRGQEAGAEEGKGDLAVAATVGFDHDFIAIPIFPGSSRSSLLEDRDPDPKTGQQNPYPGVPYNVPKRADVPKKPVGVDSFKVNWTQSNILTGPEFGRLRLEYFAQFTKDATHDPAFAEFRQNAFHTLEVTAGPHKGWKDSNAPLHDDNYSRADAKRASDVSFESNDNPGIGSKKKPLDKDDVIDYSFTAEQMIIDTGRDDKVIAKLGPHTATIKGRYPRTFDGVPVTLTY
jgi:hypothetical protein